MRFRLSVALGVIVLGVAAGRPSCPAPCGPKWTATAEALALTRSGGNPLVVATDGEGHDLLNVADLDFTYEVGMRLSLIRHLDCGWDVEVGYMGIENWHAGATVLGDSFLAPGFHLLPGQEGTVDYSAKFHSGEVSLRRAVDGLWLFAGFSFLAGFRMVEFQEQFDTYGPITFAAETLWVTATSRTRNQLYGFQIGGVGTIGRLWERMRIEGMVKAGIYYNHVLTLRGVPDIGAPDLLKDNGPAFLGEAVVYAVYQVSKHLSAKVGYQFMWLETVALAPDQYAAPPGEVDRHGGVFAHGASVGLEFTY